MRPTGVGHFVALSLALWVAVGAYHGVRPLRFLAGLTMGAVFCHLGWALLYWELVWGEPEVLADLLSGHCVLFLPLGPLLLARDAATWRTLPAALAVARVGCLPAGCCYAEPGVGSLPIGALAEIGGLMALHVALTRAPRPQVLPLFLGGFGVTRLALEPLRTVPPLGPPAVPAAVLASIWVGVAGWSTLRRARVDPARSWRHDARP